MDIVQTFYHQLADHYDKLFQDWDASVREQAQIISRLIAERGFDRSAQGRRPLRLSFSGM